MHKYNFISIMLMDGKYSEPFLGHVWHCPACSGAVRRIERNRMEQTENDRIDYLVLAGVMGLCPSTDLLMTFHGDYDGLVKDECLVDYYQKMVIQRHIDVCPACQQTLKLFELVK